MLQNIANLGSLLDSPYLYIVIIILGFIFSQNKAVFGRTLLLVSFTMIYNLGLKSIWKLPLSIPLEGWAFPSGHMHAAFVFWGWLAIEYHKIWLSEIVFLILCIVAYSLVYHGYHHPIDVAGSIIFGSISLILYWLINRLPYFKNYPYRVGYCLSFIALGIYALVFPYYGHNVEIKAIMGMLMTATLVWHILLRFNNKLLSR